MLMTEKLSAAMHASARCLLAAILPVLQPAQALLGLICSRPEDVGHAVLRPHVVYMLHLTAVIRFNYADMFCRTTFGNTISSVLALISHCSDQSDQPHCGR